ncbi:hypothetical protein M885DRAFT_566288 [Pelagophyceae sp. CCMP2097]|nr:hypothetical protein M885DRAFT_566288 [Pelagophyceae sp. CCMP2097]
MVAGVFGDIMLTLMAVLLAATAPRARGIHPQLRTRRAAVGGLVGAGFVSVSPAGALVKGLAPPPKAGPKEKRTCVYMDDCEAQGEVKANAAFQKAQPFQTTPDGVRYRDVFDGEGADVAKGDRVAIKYRVMRLGKRSSDNLSGEASPVFSLGYGEDDDATTDVLRAKVGAGELIAALDSALIGMRPGGRRRLFVVPEKGWKKINSSCLAESNGAAATGDSAGGALDLIGQSVVPLARVVNNDACLEDKAQPQPSNYGAKRRLSRRFDEGLLVEVELMP